MKHSKIAIIGAGAVGATTAYALMLRNIASEILLVDINDLRCKGEMLDLSDTLFFSMTSTIQIATLHEARSADIIIFSAGVPQKPGQSRAELLDINKKIVHDVFTTLNPLQKNTLLLMVTNPVDYLTYYAQNICGLPRNQVFGTGTLLDSIRLRNTLAQRLHVAEESVDAFVLAEHGDNQFIAWSNAHIGGCPLTSYSAFTPQELLSIEDEIRQKAYDIIACKGATYYGIAACISLICESIVFNQKRILPLSTYDENVRICLSVPVVLGEAGIIKKIPLTLSIQEQKKLDLCIQKIQHTIKT